MDAMKMLEDFCDMEPAPTRDWLAAERAKVSAAIGVAGQAPRRHATRFQWPVPPRTTIAAATAVAAVTALVIALVVPSGHGGTQPRTQTAAYVMSHTEAALSAAAGNSIAHVHRSDSSGLSEGIAIGGAPFRGKGALMAQQADIWYYGPSSTYPARYQGFTAAGQPVFDTEGTQTGDIYTRTIVDYQARIWLRDASRITPWAPPSGSALPCDDTGQFFLGASPTYWPGWIRKLMACGQFTTAGTEQVDGVEAIKLTHALAGNVEDLWVDPATYLPVRLTAWEQDRQGATLRFYNTQDVQWLPATTANLAKLTAPIPPGFVQVPAPPDKNCVGSADSQECLAPWNAWYAKYVAPRP